MLGWKDDSVLKCSGCSSTGFRVSAPHHNIWPTRVCNSSTWGPDTFSWPPWHQIFICHTYTDASKACPLSCVLPFGSVTCTRAFLSSCRTPEAPGLLVLSLCCCNFLFYLAPSAQAQLGSSSHFCGMLPGSRLMIVCYLFTIWFVLKKIACFMLNELSH